MVGFSNILILTKDVLYRLSYVSGLRMAAVTPKDHVSHQTISVDEFRVIGNPWLMALTAHCLPTPSSTSPML